MSDVETLKRISQEASNWWADIITNPKFDIGAKNAEDMFTEAIASQCVRPLSATMISDFREDLYYDIFSRISTLQDNMSVIYDCDYSPDKTLTTIADKNNIPISNFPLKTTMWVYKDAIAVRYGYGADLEYIYDSVSFWQRKLSDTEEGIKYWEKLGETELVEHYKEDISKIKAQLEICINRGEV